jgi:hypothetical protein
MKDDLLVDPSVTAAAAAAALAEDVIVKTL